MYAGAGLDKRTFSRRTKCSLLFHNPLVSLFLEHVPHLVPDLILVLPV